MYAVQALWSPGVGLSLWAEDADLPVKGASQAVRAARPHPFAASADDLADLHVGTPGTAMLLLPSLLTSPLDSPDLVRTRARRPATREPMLAAWTVPTVTLPTSEALPFLDDPGHDARYGASKRYWSEVADFAADLAEQGRVLPTVTIEDDEATARWRPVLRGRGGS